VDNLIGRIKARPLLAIAGVVLALFVSGWVVADDTSFVYLPLVMKEYAPSPTPLPADVRITGVNPGTGSALDESVTIQNLGGQAATLTNWTVRDLADHVYTFGTFTLNAAGTVRVWTSCGTDTLTDVYQCSGSPIWNNDGDTAFLRNENGGLVSQFSY